MTEPADQRICINAPAHSTSLVQAFFLARKWHHPDLSAPVKHRLGYLQLLAFQRTEIAVEWE